MYTEISANLNIFFFVVFALACLWALIHIPIMWYQSQRQAKLTANERKIYLLKQIQVLLFLIILMLGDIGIKFFLQF